MKRVSFGTLALLPLVCLAGCAAAYNCYSWGQVNCNYCPPKAMAYSNSPNCNCTDTPGQQYLARDVAKSSGGIISEARSQPLEIKAR